MDGLARTGMAEWVGGLREAKGGCHRVEQAEEEAAGWISSDGPSFAMDGATPTVPPSNRHMELAMLIVSYEPV